MLVRIPQGVWHHDEFVSPTNMTQSGQLLPFGTAAEIFRERPFAPAHESSGGGGCAVVAPGRRAVERLFTCRLTPVVVRVEPTA
jgi:hypothetical protein